MPWAGHMAIYAAKDIYRLIERAAGHAGVRQHPRPGRADVRSAVAAQQRRTCRSACITAASPSSSGARSRPRWPPGSLRAVVCTSSLDLGIDWGDIDLVVQVGAPKGAARLLQRIGRANHRLDEPSRAALVPGQPVRGAGVHRRPGRAARAHARRRRSSSPAASTCWRSTSPASPAPARSTPMRSTPRSARRRPFAELARADFDAVLDFVATGGYALATYDRYRRLAQGEDGLWRLSDPKLTPAVPHERRHHRRGAGDAGAARARQGRWARSRSTSSRCSRPATPSCSPGGCSRSRASATTR